MQGAYETNLVLVLYSVFSFSTEFPVRVVYKHQNSRPQTVSWQEKLRSGL